MPASRVSWRAAGGNEIARGRQAVRRWAGTQRYAVAAAARHLGLLLVEALGARTGEVEL
jgi:hypothetical protein